jgi:hypothetical protein
MPCVIRRMSVFVLCASCAASPPPSTTPEPPTAPSVAPSAVASASAPAIASSAPLPFQPPKPPSPAPVTADAKDAWDIGQIDPAEGRRRLLPKVSAGRASADEIAVLESLCTSMRDTACVELCAKKRRGARASDQR